VATRVFKFSLETRRLGFLAWKMAIEQRKQGREQIVEAVEHAMAHHARRRTLAAWHNAAAAAAARARTARAHALITVRVRVRVRVRVGVRVSDPSPACASRART